MDLIFVFAQPYGQEENRFEGHVLQRGLFNWFRWSLCQLVQQQGEVPGGDSPPSLWSVSVETIQEASEIFIFANINEWVSLFISNGWPVTINGTGL